jgi:hypothetical protein
LDSNGDGGVSNSELSSYLKKAGPSDGAHGAPPAGVPAGGPPPGPPPDMSSQSDSPSSTSSSNTSTSRNAEHALSAQQRTAFAYQQLESALRMSSGSSSSTANNSISVTS